MKKILFPTDFSKVANNAFIHALEFANSVNGELILLHTFELPIYDAQFFPENYNVLYDTLELGLFDDFKEQAPKLRAIAEERNLGKIKMSHRLMDGSLINTIAKVIQEDHIDFVIMGTSGATGWEAFFLGTNTESVINTVKVPVLSVPLEAKFIKIETIGFTTRYRNKDKIALKRLLIIAKKMKAKIKCLYVKNNISDVSAITIKQWEAEFAHEPIQFSIIQSDDVQGIVLDFISYKNIDVLAMLAYKRNFFAALFSTSLTHKLANNSSIPILAMQE